MPTCLRNFSLAAVLLAAFPLSAEEAPSPVDAATDASRDRDFGQPSGLPRPSSLSSLAFERTLNEFLRSRQYVDLGWHVDKGIRDTGPFIRNWNYGTHHTVRIYYSPEVMVWLTQGRHGDLPDGAMIVKEQFGIQPAVTLAGKSEAELVEALKAWTIMIKDSAGSHDGWYWSNPMKDPGDEESYDNHQYPFPHKDAGFGLYCIRCHAVTDSPATLKEYSFSSLRNINGFPGHPVLFRVDHSWRNPPKKKPGTPDEPLGAHTRCTSPTGPSVCPTQRNPEFLKLFASIPEQTLGSVLKIPPVTHDHVVRVPPDRAHEQAFVTSDQCMSCHAGLVGEFGPVMFVHTEDTSQYVNGVSKYGGQGIDYSPYGEWRWSPMGLAGRDPIFYAQMETELALLETEFGDEPSKLELISRNLVSTCLRCHGAMGKHQFDLDHAGDPHARFELDHVYHRNGIDELQSRDDQYAALARDGISCTICHRMQPRPQPETDDRPYLQYFLETSITGNFYLGPPGELYGPYKEDEISAYPMEHGIGYQPKHSPYISSSQMCGTCHTVNLPVVDYPFQPGETKNELAAAESVPEFRDFHHHVEQATYLEWLNSAYQDEYGGATAESQSCQDCHMSQDLQSPEHGIDIDRIQTQVAIIQDVTYPDAENLVSHDKMHVRVRDKYSRHNFSGLNMFLVEMFNQFDDVLGVRKVDYMTNTEQIPHAKANFMLTAAQKTARLAVETEAVSDRELHATVEVESKVGHRFPSGVGFRRAFLEVVALDHSNEGEPRVVWGSGRTNGLGVIVGASGQPLKSEFLERVGDVQQYQKHHEVITSQDQAQIYETLLQNRGGEFTTSFIHGCVTVKDNRLLPKGWSETGPDPASLTGYFLKATYPVGGAWKDPRYRDGSGSDETLYKITLPAGVDPRNVTVRATLYYQSIPPYFLKAIFETTPDTPAAKRLHFICSNLDLEDTPMEDWKLKVISAESEVSTRTARRQP